MLRITLLSSAAAVKDYHRRAIERSAALTSGSLSGYYAPSRDGLGLPELYQERVGIWGGRLAEAFGLEGPVTKEQFDRLCDHLHPTADDKLTQRTKPGRRVGYDCNFHAPKSVSLMATLSGDTRIIAAFEDAVRTSMRAMECDARTRVRVGGADETRTTGNLVWADYVHFTARPVDGVPDPHLHMHCVAFNVTHDSIESKRKAAEFGAIMRDAPYFQAVFHAQLKTNLRELGYGIERRHKGWEISDVPEAVLKAFSRRTDEIEKLAIERGITDPIQKASLAEQSRAGKIDDAIMPDLQQGWHDRIGDKHIDHLRFLASKSVHVARGRIDPEHVHTDLESALHAALEHVLARQSMVRDRDLIAETLTRTTGGVLAEDVQQLITAKLETSDLCRGEWEGEPLLTTPFVYQQEQHMIKLVHEGNARYMPLAMDHTIMDERLSLEQQQAVNHLLESIDQVMMMRGKAGVGKTRTMHEVVDTLKAHGVHVQPVAIGAKITDGVLRKDGFTNAVTLAKWFHDAEIRQKSFNGVLWIDEANQVGVPDLTKVMEHAKKLNCRVLMTGDLAQHHGVQRGDAMKLIEEFGAIEAAELNQIRRQLCIDYRDACDDLAKGHIKSGFEKLDRMGAIREISDNGDRVRTLADEYIRCTTGKRTAVVVSPTHKECAMVTGAIRDQLKAAGRIGEKEVTIERLQSRFLSPEEKSDAAMYRPGDVVQFMQHIKGGIKRGERAVITHADDKQVVATRERNDQEIEIPLHHADRLEVYERKTMNLSKGDLVRITHNGVTKNDARSIKNGATLKFEGVNRSGDLKFANGKVLDRDFQHVNQGYCLTSHAAEGDTSGYAITAQSAMSAGGSNARQFYTTVTRGRHGVIVFTDDKEALLKWIERSASRVNAMEGMGRQPIRRPPMGQTRDFMRDAMSRQAWRMTQSAERERTEREQSQARDQQRSRDRSRGGIEREWGGDHGL